MGLKTRSGSRDRSDPDVAIKAYYETKMAAPTEVMNEETFNHEYLGDTS